MASNIMSTNFQDKLFRGFIGESGPNKSVYLNIVKKFGVLISNTEQVEVEQQPQEFTTSGHLITEDIETLAESPLTKVRHLAETIAVDVILTFGQEDAKTPPNKYCKAMRRTVKQLTARHDLVFKGIVKKLNPDEENALQTFVTVADELFDEGQVNWGRVVAVYAFAAHLTKHLAHNETGETEDANRLKLKEIVAQFVGKYVANKLGQWIVDHGGWDAFVEYFPDQVEFEAKLWKFGLMTTLGLGALATIFATR